MNRLTTWFFIVLLASTLSFSQQATSSAQAGAVIGHGSFPVKVTKTLDSSKLKDGDLVEVETAGSFKLPDGTLIQKGSKMYGQIVLAKARSRGDSESQLNIRFDRVVLPNRQQLTVKGIIQGVLPAAEEVDPGVANGPTMARSAGPGYQPTDIKNGSNMETSGNSQAVLDPKVTGVQGMHDLSLDNGVLTSKGKNVKLGNGVRLIIRAEILGRSESK